MTIGFLRTRQGIVFVILFTLFFLNACMTFRTSDQQLEKYFIERAVSPIIHRDTFQNIPIRYIETYQGDNNNSVPLVIFVHGAPGSSDAFNQYLADTALLRHARLISVDRLGYGYSNFGKAETSIAIQAELICHISKKYTSKKVVLVGHSYGGPIIARCAMHYPELIDRVIMLAPVNDPISEPIFWFAYFAKWKLTRWMLPKTFKVSGDEKFSHVAELEQMEHLWQTLTTPITHIHGTKDKLAPPANIQFSEQNIPKDLLKMVVLENGSHFVPWKNFDLVKQELLLLFDSEKNY